MKIFFSRFFFFYISLYLLSLRMDIESNSLEFEKFLNFLENSNEKILFHIFNSFSHIELYIYH